MPERVSTIEHLDKNGGGLNPVGTLDYPPFGWMQAGAKVNRCSQDNAEI
jgi:hypothetical protein